MRHLNSIKKIVRQLAVSVAVLNLVFPTPIFAAYIEIGDNMNFRVDSVGPHNQYVLKSLTVLPKGTVLEIPDRYLIKKNGRLDFNASINNWIELANISRIKYDNNGKSDFDYFFKVKVISIPGSKKFKDQVGYVNLKYLAESGGIKLSTIKPAKLYDAQPKNKNIAQTEYHSKNSNSETEAKVCLGDCDNDPGLIQKIKLSLNKTLRSIKTKTDQKLQADNSNFNGLQKNFNSSCYGLKFNDFISYLKEQTENNGIPPEVLLGMMSVESSGFCHAVGDKTSTSKSVGLFQVNSRSASGIRLCSYKQYQQLKGKSIEEMANDRSLKCLQNPAINLEAAIDILKKKYNDTNDINLTVNHKAWNQLSDEEKDRFKKAISGYNGGQNWVNIAQNDVKEASEKFGINLNSNNWETLRLFYFRKILRGNGIVSSHESTRKYEFNISNIAYVDAVAGRSSGENKQSGLADIWSQILYPQSSSPISVATSKN